MGANSNDLNIARLHYRSELANTISGALSNLVLFGTVGVCFYFLIDFFKFACVSNPDNVGKLAGLIKEFKLHIIVSSLAGVALAAWGGIQRFQRNRAIEKLDECRKLRESGDKHRAGSGLTKKGATPKPSKKKG